MWSQCLVDVLDEVLPGHEIGAADIRPHLRGRFPWHEPGRSHLDLSTPDRWWESLSPLFFRAYEAVGVPVSKGGLAVSLVRQHYCDPARFHLYPESIDALETLRRNGWELVILSNHVPELQSIVEGVGLGSLIDKVYSSALTGYEKPNRESYRIALDDDRPADSFMVGDNVEADVLGAERIGLPAILVRSASPDATRFAPDLQAAVGIILDS
jgi:putative hydrolase of the HAD superfamily